MHHSDLIRYQKLSKCKYPCSVKKPDNVALFNDTTYFANHKNRSHIRMEGCDNMEANVKCKKCGYEFKPRKKETQKKRQCPRCSSTQLVATFQDSNKTPSKVSIASDIENDPEIVKLKKELRKAEIEREVQKIKTEVEMDERISNFEEWLETLDDEVVELKENFVNTLKKAAVSIILEQVIPTTMNEVRERSRDIILQVAREVINEFDFEPVLERVMSKKLNEIIEELEWREKAQKNYMENHPKELIKKLDSMQLLK